MRRMTTIQLNGREYPIGPLVCDCPGWREWYEQAKAQQKAQQEAEERRRREQRIEELFRTSGLPARWRHRTFDSFEITPENKEAYEKARQYADGFNPREGKGLLLTGTVGTGKTHLAAAIAMELLSREHWVVFGTVTTLLNDIRNTFDDDAKETQANVLRRLTRCELLIIDDLGKEAVTEWVEQTVFEVVNARYEACRSLIVTTNMQLREIRDRYKNVGTALVDRILEMCEGVRMTGTSWRKKAVL